MNIKYSKEKNRTIILWFLFIRILTASYFISQDFYAWISSIFKFFVFILLYTFIIPQIIAFILILKRNNLGYYVLLSSVLSDYLLLRALWEAFLKGESDVQSIFEIIFFSSYYIVIIILPILQLRIRESEI